MIVLGLMSGTSIDGIEAALVRFDADGSTLELRLLATSTHAIPPALRTEALAIIPPGTGSTRRVCALDFALGEAFAAAAQAAIHAAGRHPDLIASHGQTVYHLVEEDGHVQATLQLGQPAIIAERTGVTVAADFRPRDVAAGGQGAPLVSLFDILLFQDLRHTRAILNIGGIGNATILPAGGDPDAAFAFDTGPGNSLMDHAAAQLSGGELVYDEDGTWAAQGEAHTALLDLLLAHPYYAARPPKTTGKEMFGPAYVDTIIARARDMGIGDADLMATLTMLTARSISDAFARFGGGVDEVIGGGGGMCNPTLMRMLAAQMPGVRIRRADEFGIPVQSKEAIAFALLGYRLVLGQAGNAPGCTGARRAVPLGSLTPGANFGALLTKSLGQTGGTAVHIKVCT